MPFSSIAVANRFIELASEDHKKLTNMQLQKLVFLANGFSLALLDRLLSYHNIHAWQWGPVFPQLYKSFSKAGSNPIDDKAPCEESIPKDGEDDEVIRSVWGSFGKMSGAKLSSLTHEPDSPWDTTWRQCQYGIIDPEIIKKYYKQRLNV